MPEPMKIRPARLDETELLRAFEQGIIDAERAYDPLLRPDPISYYDLSELIHSPDAEVLIGEIAGSPVASGYVKKNASRPYTQPAFHAFLGFLYVHPDHRGRGLNQQMLDRLLGWARERDLHEIRLTVYPNNEPAMRAYEKAGFTPYLTEMRYRLED